MEKIENLYQRCEICGRRLRKLVPDEQISIVEPLRICGNCIRRIKEKRNDKIIMEMRGQRRLF